MKRHILLLLSLITFNILMYAQNGSISGTLVDKNSKAILNATIKLYIITSDSNDVFKEGTISDSLGNFKFENLNTSKYFLNFSHLNYDDYFTEVLITENQNKTLSPIILSERLNQLNEIVISGKKIPITQTADKITINVASNVLGAGGTPLDILRQLPTVSVSSEGNISIRGKNDIQILINGKPSGFAALQGQRILDQLDLSTINKIEVITSPSVIQSTSGAGGVINIITKKQNKNGFNGHINTGVGNDEWYHFSPGLNYRFGKINAFINYSLRHRKRLSENSSLRSQEVSDIFQHINQNQKGTRNDKRHSAEMGFDYYISEHKYLTFAGNYRSRNKKDNQERTSFLSNNNELIESRFGTIKEPETNEGWGAIAQYSSLSNDTNSTNLLLNYVHSVEDEDIFREELVSSDIVDVIDGIQTFYVDINDRVLLDFEHKTRLKDSTQITYGCQAIYRKIQQTFNALQFSNDTSLYETISALTDQFNYEDVVSSVYFQAEKKYDKWSYEAAIKFELLQNQYSTQSTNESFKNDYFKFFPSLKLTYDIDEKTSSVFSVKKGLNRPSPNRLNPFPDVTNAFNISIGNPELNPEVFYNIETGLNTKINKVSFTASLFYTIYSDLIQRVSELRNDGLTYRFPVNINNMHHYGADMNVQIKLTKWWNQQIGGLVFNRTYDDDLVESTEKIAYQIKSTSSIAISDSMNFQVFGSYTAPENTVQGEIEALYFADAGFDYDFLNKKAKCSLTITDIFDTIKEKTILINDGLIQNSSQKINTQRVYLTFNYKF